MSVKVQLLFFAKARELTGLSETVETQLFGVEAITEDETDATIGARKTTGSQLLKLVLSSFPDLEPIKDSIILAHNLEYIDIKGTTPITVKHGDEIAVIPPVSGG